jgi:secretion/DNA translocation related TadE-like protein
MVSGPRPAATPPRASMRSDDQRGSSTVYVLSLVMLLTAVTVGVAGFAGLAVAKHRVAAAADLAALAAATRPGDGCAVADGTARRNGVRLTSCRLEGADVTVTVAMVASAPFGLRPTVSARARAGPRR